MPFRILKVFLSTEVGFYRQNNALSSNSDLLNIINKISFKLLVLVSDKYQIESIRFGNWFNIISSFIPGKSTFELTSPYRTKEEGLLKFWDSVRSMSDDIEEIMAQNNYSTELDGTIFQPYDSDEIILCLNYDGFYGINNINLFLQNINPNNYERWGASVYKIGDPVLFHDSDRLRPVIYNNLKGKIVDIKKSNDKIEFQIEINRSLTENDITEYDDLEWVDTTCQGTIVRIKVYNYSNFSDENNEPHDRLITVPFQTAYAVSIHKAQGLEYNSVKIVITDDNEITHSIFYTAVTRARKNIKIYWTAITQASVISKIHKKNKNADYSLLHNRINITKESLATEGVSS